MKDRHRGSARSHNGHDHERQLSRPPNPPEVHLAETGEFDYGRLPASQRISLERDTQAVRELLISTASNVVQIGLRLKFIREWLSQEQFQGWLQLEFQWSQGTASNYMRAAAAFSELDCIKHFQPSALYVLARERSSDKARAEAIRRARAGELISKATAEQLVRELGRPPAARRHDRVPGILARINTLEAELDTLEPHELQSCTEQLAALLSKLLALEHRQPPGS